MPEASYELLVDGEPVPAEVLGSVQLVEVEEHAHLADMIRLELTMATDDTQGGYPLLERGLFGRLTEVEVRARVGPGEASTLVVGHVIESNAKFADDPGASTLEVVAMDPSVLLTLEERVRAWPNAADSDVAATIFGEHGFDAEVEATQPVRSEPSQTQMQRGSDMRLLRTLASRNGYEVFVEHDPSSGRTVGHFHPPRVDVDPQGVLNVGMAEATNVDRFSVRHDRIQPAETAGAGIDPTDGSRESVELAEGEVPEMGSSATLAGQRRRTLLDRTGASASELRTFTQAAVERSSWAVTSEGELNALAYGGVLRAKRPVLVRGVGPTYSGRHYVERVRHVFTPAGYKQRFALRRNATGVTGDEPFGRDRKPATGGASP